MCGSSPPNAITDYSFPDLGIEEGILRPLGHELVALKDKRPPSEIAAFVGDADAVITQFAPVNAEVIGAMRQAKVIVRYGVRRSTGSLRTRAVCRCASLRSAMFAVLPSKRCHQPGVDLGVDGDIQGADAAAAVQGVHHPVMPGTGGG